MTKTGLCKSTANLMVTVSILVCTVCTVSTCVCLYAFVNIIMELVKIIKQELLFEYIQCMC